MTLDVMRKTSDHAAMKEAMRTAQIEREPRWRGPTVLDIARVAGVGTATVDRVLNARSGVREATRQKVLAALAELSGGPKPDPAPARRAIAFLAESGANFNRSLEEAVESYRAADEGVDCSFTAVPGGSVDPVAFAQLIERTAERADGIVLVAREDLTINRAIRAVTARGVPVVCVTTDLPSSGRLAYVGSDQASAGATAGYLMGRLVGGRAGRILLVISASYRCQEERELGFRRVLRAEFPDLDLDERVHSWDDPEHAYRSVRRYIEEHGPPVGIYNTAAGNQGIARALREDGLRGRVVVIAHELNPSSRMLLESGELDVVIGHDLDHEVALSIATVTAFLDGHPVLAATRTRVRVHTKFNAD
jgi:LacI family transcriptional regulator